MQHVRHGSSKILYHFEWPKQKVPGQVLLKHKTAVNVKGSHEGTLWFSLFANDEKKQPERLLRHRRRKRKGRLALQFCQKINNNKVQKNRLKITSKKKKKKKLQEGYKLLHLPASHAPTLEIVSCTHRHRSPASLISQLNEIPRRLCTILFLQSTFPEEFGILSTSRAETTTNSILSDQGYPNREAQLIK